MLSWKPTTPSNWWLNPRPERVWGFFCALLFEPVICLRVREYACALRKHQGKGRFAPCLCQSTLISISEASDICSRKWFQVPSEFQLNWNRAGILEQSKKPNNNTIPICSKIECEVKYSEMRYMSSLFFSGIGFGTSWFLFKIKHLRGGYPVDIPKFQVPARTKGFEGASLSVQEPVTRCKAWALKTPHNHSIH